MAPAHHGRRLSGKRVAKHSKAPRLLFIWAAAKVGSELAIGDSVSPIVAILEFASPEEQNAFPEGGKAL